MKKITLLYQVWAVLTLTLLSTPLLAQTVLQAGDIAIVAYNTNLSAAPISCGGSYGTDDVIAFLTFKDITPNTKFIFTDNGYNTTTGVNHTFRSGEGIAEFTRTGATIPAGTIFYIAFGDSPAICGSGTSICSQGWSVASVQGASLSFLDMNSTAGDQLFILQGTFTSLTNFVGEFIYGITTNPSTPWTFNNNATTSNLPAQLNCLNFVSTTPDRNRYNGSLTANTKTAHLTNIYNTSNWTTASVTTNPNCPTSSNFRFNGFPTLPITINPEPPSSNAGPDQNICITSATMAAVGTGTWSIVQGAGSFSSLTSPTATVTGLALGINIFRWTTNSCVIAEVRITVGPAVGVSIASNPSNGVGICAGTEVTFNAAPVNGGTAPTYQWILNGNPIAGATNSSYTTSSIANGDGISVVLTSNAGCINPTATSNVLTFAVFPALTPNVSISANPTITTICANTNITFTANATGVAVVPNYQWQINGANVGANSPTFSTTALANGDQVRVILTSNDVCAVATTANSNTITYTVSPSVIPSVSIAANPDPAITTVCAGTNVTFTATPTNGGTIPAYQWQVNGVNVGTNSPMFSTSTLANGDQVRVILTSNATCATTSTANNSITYTVSPSVTPSVSIDSNTPTTTICAGTNITFTATPTNGGTTPIYQWQVNGGNVGANSPTFSTSTLVNGDQVRVILTSNVGCATSTTANSNALTYTVNPNVTPSVSIVANPTASTICIGTLVTFTATPTNGGTPPIYQWQINGANVGTNSATFSTSNLANNDQVRVILTSNAACAITTTANSNTITYTVNPTVTPTVSISTNANSETCQGSTILLTATATNPGTAPVYQWLINGSVVVGSNNTLSVNTTNLGSSFTAQARLTSNATCLSNAIPVNSNTLNIGLKNCLVSDLFIPDAFTPSQNNNSKSFRIEGDEASIRSFELKIYDRFGNLMYETNSFTEIKNNGWNGQAEGKEQPTAVYFWQINGVFTNGNSVQFNNKNRGSVHLIR